VDPKQYLKRIHCSIQQPTIKFLQQLQKNHMYYVPFENLDVMRRVPIYLNLETIYEKIVTNKRGGYCYEVNGLFQWLLEAVGFDTYLVGATVMRPTGEFAKKNTHVGIIVTLDQPYLVDVGFGNSQLQPLTLDGQTFTDVSGTYKVKQLDDITYDLMRIHDNAWRTLYRFQLKEMSLSGFHEGVVYNQVSKNSSFTHADLITKPTETGRITLRDHTLTITYHGEKTEQKLTPSEKTETLRKTFGIYLDD